MPPWATLPTIWQLLTIKEDASVMPNERVNGVGDAAAHPSPPLAPAPPGPPRLSLRLMVLFVMIARSRDYYGNATAGWRGPLRRHWRPGHPGRGSC